MSNHYRVHLRNRGSHIKHGVIKISYDIREVLDDVDAAMIAKQRARQQFPDRGDSSWIADRVERR